MNSEMAATLETVFSNVLENYAFLFCESAETCDADDSGPWIKNEMGFAGPFKGRLCLLCPERFGNEVAANVLGLDLDDEQVNMSARDALKELLNVTCGNLLTALAGETPVFELIVPKVYAVDEAEWRQNLNDAEMVHVQVGCNTVILGVSIEGGGLTGG
jgi:chemotaxis protein CheY-P-specific phosphatase CheC